MKKFCYILFLILLISSLSSAEEEDDFRIDMNVDKGDDAVYYEGEPIFISFHSTKDAYIFIYDIDTNGKISAIYPESSEEKGFIKANKTYRIPAEVDDYSFRVKGPSGEEFICCVTSSEPLHIPSIFEEQKGDTYFQVEGEPEEAIKDIADEILKWSQGSSAVDVCHFFVEEEKDEFMPPLPPFPTPPFCGSLKIQTKPRAAKIYLDGRYFGRTPAVIGGIPPGKHRLLLTKNGYYKYSKMIHINGGDIKTIRLNLKWKLW